jgi:small subunit ribosomal protein S5e
VFLSNIETGDIKAGFVVEPTLFGKWSYKGIECEDNSLESYVSVKQTKAKVFYPHTAGKYQAKQFDKVKCPLVERLVNSLMMKGRNNGKKHMAIRIVKQTFEIIHLLTGENPIKVLVDAISNCGSREDSTRIGSGGNVKRQAVDVSPLRRVNQAFYLMSLGARQSSFRNIRSIAECLSDEIINASKNNSNSFAVKKKEETERTAKGNR